MCIRDSPAFHPNGPQEVLSLHPAVFALLRSAPDGSERVLCLHNVSGEDVEVHLEPGTLPSGGTLRDLVSGRALGSGRISLETYQTVWLSVE